MSYNQHLTSLSYFDSSTQGQIFDVSARIVNHEVNSYKDYNIIF